MANVKAQSNDREGLIKSGVTKAEDGEGENEDWGTEGGGKTTG